jgi:hypothetical protein
LLDFAATPKPARHDSPLLLVVFVAEGVPLV